jgi:Yip1 domain
MQRMSLSQETPASHPTSSPGKLGSIAPPSSVAPGLPGRVKGILFAPQTEWLFIARECTTPAHLYTRYVMPLVAFAALIAFVRVWLAARAPLLSALVLSTLTFGCELLGVYMVSLIINALAVSFRGARSQQQALKVATYAFTPIWISAIFVPFPSLSTPMQLLGGIYYTYLLYLGLSRVMKSPRDRALGYATTVVLSSIILGIVFTLLGDAVGQAIHVGHYHAFG